MLAQKMEKDACSCRRLFSKLCGTNRCAFLSRFFCFSDTGGVKKRQIGAVYHRLRSTAPFFRKKCTVFCTRSCDGSRLCSDLPLGGQLCSELSSSLAAESTLFRCGEVSPCSFTAILIVLSFYFRCSHVVVPEAKENLSLRNKIICFRASLNFPKCEISFYFRSR